MERPGKQESWVEVVGVESFLGCGVLERALGGVASLDVSIPSTRGQPFGVLTPQNSRVPRLDDGGEIIREIASLIDDPSYGGGFGRRRK